MSRFNWACPTCGAATHSKEALVRSSEKSCSCDSALWVASDMPPCVGKLQEEIAALETSLAERWENLNVQDGVIDGLQEEIAALRAEKLTDASALRLALERIAALEKVAEAAPELERVKYAWALYCGRGSKWDDAWREAGYLGGGE